MRVLVVEDEPRLARNVSRILTRKGGYAVDVSTDGVDGRHMALTNPYDLIVLDLMLPGVGGMQILRELRGQGRRTPVLILTARDSRDDVVEGLETGGDDYLTKPFDAGELVARCKALIRRSYERPDPVIRVGELTIDTKAHSVAAGGGDVMLSAMEYRLIEYLAMRAGEIVSKEDIIEHLYDFGAETFSNVVEVYISSLRRKLRSAGADGLIRTYRNQGYRLEGEAS